MLDDGFDKGTRIGTSENQAQFTDVTVNNVRTLLLKLICIDRQCIHVTMLNQELGSTAAFGIVELAVGVDALVAIFKQRMPEHVVDVGMLVTPDKRYLLAIIVLECVSTNDATVRTFQIVTCCPSAEIKIVIHFEFALLPCFYCSFYQSVFLFHPDDSDCY